MSKIQKLRYVNNEAKFKMRELLGNVFQKTIHVIWISDFGILLRV